MRHYVLAGSGSAALLGLVACGPQAASGPIDIGITAEEAVQTGLPFTKAPPPGTLVFLDGWSLEWKRWLVVVDNLRLSEPGKDTAQQQLVGATVAAHSGPLVVDLKKAERTPLVSFASRMDGQPFDTTVRYAFSFDLVPYTASALPVNLDAASNAALSEMASRGYSNYVEVTATHAPFEAGDNPLFQSYPTRVNVAFGWGGRVSYINCDNPDNGGEGAASRGISALTAGVRSATIHLHSEHPFWDKLNVENPPLRFDAIAARATTMLMGTELVGTVTLDALSSSLTTGPTDLLMRPVYDRGVVAGYVRKSGPLSYDANGTPGVDTLKSFIVYSAQAMAHLNGEGLCFVDRRP